MGSSGENHTDRILVIMAKAPRAGMVKTRLTRGLRVKEATDLYRCLLEDTLALAGSLPAVKAAIMCPGSDVEQLTAIAGDVATVVAQKGEGLAAGLNSVFAHFTADGKNRVVAFNSDSPHLAAQMLLDAFEILNQNDIAVGPTYDGGYYLVGAKTAQPGLFDVNSMGTGSALDVLTARAGERGLSIGFTDPFYDIDEMGDLARLSRELELDPSRAPRTAAWLKERVPVVSEFRAGENCS